MLLAGLCLLSAWPSWASPLKLTIRAPDHLLKTSVSRLAIDDTLALLEQAFPGAEVTLNGNDGSVRLILETTPPAVPGSRHAPDNHSNDSYRWNAISEHGTRIIRLKAATPHGVANGLYGLLQDKLGFRFYHPRESIIPRYTRWPLEPRFTLQGVPRFANRGFHLHTLHPIELTDQLHDPTIPGAFNDVASYLDWLARNGQNTFQFFLLRSVDRSAWPAHARRIVEYAHSRGIRCGVEISLAMIQQQAFQAITVLRLIPSYKRQVDATLAWIFQAPWDMISLEATMGEHLPFLDRLLPGVQAHLERQVQDRFAARLMYATHVICAAEGEKVRRPQLLSSGILIHTVMCYSASDSRAPVYGNSNQRFMLDAARSEKQRRETWYWPESSYWVGFDSSVPLLILSYLDARWTDIHTMGTLGMHGHLTFTSGWEWGYWLVDWSIARWTWQLKDNGRERRSWPLSRFAELNGDRELQALMEQALTLQNSYLKDKELLRFMSALTPFSELPHPFDKPFQPEPVFRYDWLLTMATGPEASKLLDKPIQDLEEYAERMGRLVRRMNTIINRHALSGSVGTRQRVLTQEITRGLEVTALRAGHRALTLRAIMAKRTEHAGRFDHSRHSGPLLAKARILRQQAQLMVQNQENGYRYPLVQIARRRSSMTAYQFGYLYPASRLFFWEREEKQIEQERFDALFMNVWDMRRIVGLESLMFNR